MNATPHHGRRVVVALDSFKGTIGAAEACRTVEAAWLDARPQDSVVLRPMADGGEGTVDAFAVAVDGATREAVTVRGPDGGVVTSSWLLLPGGTGVVELASTSGIELLGERRLPFDADTFGFGQAIAASLAYGVDRLVLGIGSSASTDGGVGMLRALGARFLDSDGSDIAPGLRGLADLASVDLAGLVPLPDGGVRVLSDVTNPLLGPTGAAAVFGPQKGLQAYDVASADRALGHLAGFLAADPWQPGAGAAGGTGFALLAWGGELVPGANEVAELVDLSGALTGADLAITGEGFFDDQSLHGKAPGFVADAAGTAGAPVALIAGGLSADADLSAFVESRSLTGLAGSAQRAVADPRLWLGEAARQIAACEVGSTGR